MDRPWIGIGLVIGSSQYIYIYIHNRLGLGGRVRVLSFDNQALSPGGRLRPNDKASENPRHWIVSVYQIKKHANFETIFSVPTCCLPQRVEKSLVRAVLSDHSIKKQHKSRSWFRSAWVATSIPLGSNDMQCKSYENAGYLWLFPSTMVLSQAMLGKMQTWNILEFESWKYAMALT